MLSPDEPLIDDVNFPLPANSGYESRDWKAHPYGSVEGATPFDLDEIPRSEWADRIHALEANGQLLSKLMVRQGVESLDQGQTNYCWANGPITGILAVRASNGLEYVKLSPASVAAPIKNFKNQGGWGSQALKYIVENGVCPAEDWPANAISRIYFTEENRKLAAKYKVTEWWELENRNFSQLMTLLLVGIPVAVGYDWWRHEVCAIDPVLLGSNKFGVRIRNSWGSGYGDNGFAVLTESKATPDDAVAPRVVTATNEV